MINEKLSSISREKVELEDLLKNANTEFPNDEDVLELYKNYGAVFKETVVLEDVHVDDFDLEDRQDDGSNDRGKKDVDGAKKDVGVDKVVSENVGYTLNHKHDSNVVFDESVFKLQTSFFFLFLKSKRMGNKLSDISHRPRMDEFNDKDCISVIVSLLASPRDASRAAGISKTVKEEADSDLVWEKFLPPDYGEVISRAVSPVKDFQTKKKLYMYLSESHVLLDRGTLGFKLDKDSGKKCYMLGAHDLSIAWHDDTRYWERGHVPESRFAEVAILKEVWWLDICGTIPSVILSPKSTYVAYLVFRITKDSWGLDVPAKTTVSFGGISNETSNIYLKQPQAHAHANDEPPTNAAPTTRKDGMEEVSLLQAHLLFEWISVQSWFLTYFSLSLSCLPRWQYLERYGGLTSAAQYQDSWGLAVPAKTTVSFGGISNETSNVYLKQPQAHAHDEPPTNAAPTTRKDGMEEVSLLQAHLLFEWIIYKVDF
ncbi:F-box domain, Phloem protein 2-like protein [Artemisia annua]|uniref:F-box domain, Phloem protein 2-like protein n=1 Tax=Artemisia annua TaxID=35608 RepID=A0A2U1QJ62_ARTAN|nr:F-box domain, Phloem protein 2-like protein [Artemisia annua]